MPTQEEFWVLTLIDGSTIYICNTQYCASEAEVIEAFYKNKVWNIPKQSRVFKGTASHTKTSKKIDSSRVVSLSRKHKTIYNNSLLKLILILAVIALVIVTLLFNSSYYITSELSDVVESTIQLQVKSRQIVINSDRDIDTISSIQALEDRLDSLSLLYNIPTSYKIHTPSCQCIVYRKMLNESDDWNYLLEILTKN